MVAIASFATTRIVPTVFCRICLTPLYKLALAFTKSAVIAPDADIAQAVSIGPNVVIESGVTVGENVVIGPNSVVGAGAILGAGCRLHANVTLYSNVTLDSEPLFTAGQSWVPMGLGLRIMRAGGIKSLS